MNEGTAMALFFILIIGGIVGLIYYVVHTRHKEKIMLIEKGADAKLFQTEPRKKNYFFAVIVGIIFICLALGILLGAIFSSIAYNSDWISHEDNPLPYFTSIFLMIGVGFLASFYASKKLNG